jgi:transcriptional regulator with PAS, ATPase and Fis domain
VEEKPKEEREEKEGKEEKGGKDLLREFEENPYNPEKQKPEEVVRLFYTHDIPIIPVVTRRGLLVGILKKDDVVSELSDIERVKNQKIDQFITRLAKKLPLDDILPYIGAHKEFVTIDIFGEVRGMWTRLDLFAACESPRSSMSAEEDLEKNKEKQVMEWLIYLILEHIPRAIYAVNEKGKTIFYNSNFEELYEGRKGKEVEIGAVEESLKNPQKNEFFSRKKEGKEIYFYNKEMKFYYEKVPLVSNEKTVGYLYYCDRDMNEEPGVILPGVNIKGLSLGEILEAVERGLIVDSLNEHGHDVGKAAGDLKATRPQILSKIKKFGISIDGGAGRKGKK